MTFVKFSANSVSLSPLPQMRSVSLPLPFRVMKL